MGKTVRETYYRRLKPIRQGEKCAVCPSGCKAFCLRQDVVAEETEKRILKP
ncbi:MAG TPA: hypothetical protein GX503_00575 [Clostridiales bacterium]|nr:hypothetical protein [Clostridiales bacterium]